MPRNFSIRSIANHQKVWSNFRDFIERQVGTDPVISNNQPES
ncbi:MAG: hypothetical protein QNJ54_02040 [Prochloraceae cyanobacterium]|nr:hypothetical protein [Prochloraceae cyanobacterium]